MMPNPNQRHFVLTFSCPDKIGIVFVVSRELLAVSANILDSAQFSDPESGRFFMRVAFEAPADTQLGNLQSIFEPLADSFEMQWSIYDLDKPVRTLIMVSKFDHCLNDLLYRHAMGELPLSIEAIVSNHHDAEKIATQYGLDFYHLPITPQSKAAQESSLLALIEALDVELVVLARYMQVLSSDLCRYLAGRAINIHHSFLPSFKGAKPYHQAYARGVKLIGATAHFVTSDLDEGPIIDQGVVSVGHAHSAGELVALGRDVERVVLARSVRAFAERRILLNGIKTVIFAP